MESKNFNPTIEEANQKIDQSFEYTDQLRLEGLTKLNTLQRLKQRALLIERKQLITKYGPANPRVSKVEAKLKFNDGFIRDIKVEMAKAQITPPTVGKETWLVHGRILNSNHIGVKNQTVYLINDNNQRVKDLGYDCTDEYGYFSITYTRPSENKRVQQFPNVFLTVSDKDKNILHREKEAHSVVTGQIKYREIILGEDQCEEPPTDGSGDDNGNGDGGENNKGCLSFM